MFSSSCRELGTAVACESRRHKLFSSWGTTFHGNLRDVLTPRASVARIGQSSSALHQHDFAAGGIGDVTGDVSTRCRGRGGLNNSLKKGLQAQIEIIQAKGTTCHRRGPKSILRTPTLPIEGPSLSWFLFGLTWTHLRRTW